LAATSRGATVVGVQPDLIDRKELTAMLFAIADMNSNIRAIRELLEEEHGGQEGVPEADT
jgi:hypothetical protein